MDHGIEIPEARRLAGKHEVGRIRFDAVQNADGISLFVGDDGRGLALDKLRSKALANGLLTEAQAMDDDLVADCIFQSGLSTAETLSMVSGRGVGMDAVRAELARIGVAIHVSWIDGGPAKDGYRPFVLVLELPADVLSEPLFVD